LTRPIVIAIIGLAVAALALLLALDHDGDEASLAPTQQAQPLVPLASAEDSLDPAIDVARVDADGDAVFAGRARANAVVTLSDGAADMGQVTADGRGEWVFVPAEPLLPGARELQIKAALPEDVTARSGAPVVLVVPERGQGPAVAVKPVANGGSRLLQDPGVGEDLGGLSLDVVDHDARGRLFLGGKAPSGARIHAYLDNSFLGRAEADGDGTWRVAGSGPTSGSHVLRADQVGEKGKVVARVETAFTPAEDVALTEAQMGDDDKGANVAVAPGSSLWRIARRSKDSGIAYTVVFRANRAQIREAGTVYPGQVFSVPGGH
jgi:nucleoid-associated protein YgaU